MKLWLLRHGEAEPESGLRFDAERRLTERGGRQIHASAKHLANHSITSILVSPYKRAQQTAAIICEVLDYQGVIQTVPWLTPDSSPKEVIIKLDLFADQDVLLVAHQPLLGTLAGLLIHGHRESPLPMATGTLLELEGDMVAAGVMTLASSNHPVA